VPLHTRKKMSAGDDYTTESNDENDDNNDNNNNDNNKIILQTHFLLFLSQVNWMGMHIVFAVALRSSTKALVLSFYRELLACVLLTAYCCFWWFRGRSREGKEEGGEEGGLGEELGDGDAMESTTEALRKKKKKKKTAADAVVVGGVNTDAKKKNDDENKVTSTQIILVSVVLGAILALIRGSVVLANANAGPDVTSALVLTTPVLTFFFSALLRVEHFSFREVNREHPENAMKVLAILFVTISVAVVCSYKGALMFGDPKEYEAPNVAVGAIWMLTNTLASSVAIVMQKMIINANIPIEVVNAAMTGIGAFWLLIVGLIAHGTARDIWTLSSDGVYAVLFGAFFPSAMNLIIFAKSSKLLGPNITARYFLLQPAMTWLLDYLVLRDAVYESYVICAFFSALAMMSFASANSFVRSKTGKTEEEKEEAV
jgi:drug/metabolite transporter (DMT)-like permease